MSVQASRVRVQQHGDAVIGECTDVQYDERTRLLTQNRTTLAEVPVEGGGTALLRVTAVSATAVPPNDHEDQAPQVARFSPVPERGFAERSRPRRKQHQPMPSGEIVYPLCGCIVCLASVGIILSTVLTGLLHCEPHFAHAVVSIILASLACCMSCLCFTCILQPTDLERNLSFFFLGFCCVSVVFVLFVAAVVVDGLYTYDGNDVGHENLVLNETSAALIMNGTCKHWSSQSFGVSVTSYVLVVVFVLFSCVTGIECLRSFCLNCWYKQSM